MSYQKSGKYACFEFEKKFLITGLPEALKGSNDYIQIEDRYFPNTNLRLRILSSPDGIQTSRKLTQKYVAQGANLSKTCITNIYLTESEAFFLDQLQGVSIKKFRYSLSHGCYNFSVDEFNEPFNNLILAEIEFETEEEMNHFACPFLDWKDVSLDKKYSGGSLALMNAYDL